jgi:hypothetical protein
MDKGSILLSRLCLQHSGDHLQSGIAQALNAATGHPRIRICECHNHALNAGLNHRLRARRRSPLMTARLKRDDDRPAPGARTSLSECTHLGMGLPCLGMKAFSDQSPLSIQHHSTH